MKKCLIPSRPTRTLVLSILFLCLPTILHNAQAVESRTVLHKGARVAIIGDSITEQKLYSKYIEVYLLACCPELDITTCQFGWSGERAAGFLNRMKNDMSWFKPTVATLCYGMNDGGYKQISPDIEKGFEDPMRGILRTMKSNGVFAVVGGPGAVDTKYFSRVPAQVYNENLGQLSHISSNLAQENGFVFANLHQLMMDAMSKAKAANGEQFPVCGTDGVHPQQDGHLVMAYAFLKALGVSGDIGTITLSMASGKASVSEGHGVLSSSAGKIEIESRRYPFCFSGNPKDASSTLAILPFIPFNEELNRLTLKIDDLPWEKARITWGDTSKIFTKAQLGTGINLAAEFASNNPFTAALEKLQAAVTDKQNLETTMIKQWLTKKPAMLLEFKDDAEFAKHVEGITSKYRSKWESLVAAEKAAFTPVRHTIQIERAD